MPALAYAYKVRPEQSKPLMAAPLFPPGEQPIPYAFPDRLPPPHDDGTPRWESAASRTVRTLADTSFRSGFLAAAVYRSIHPSTLDTYAFERLYWKIEAFSCDRFARSRPLPHR